MQTIHGPFDQHQGIARTVRRLDNGVDTVTESADAKVQVMIREHVAAMYQRLIARQPVRAWGPAYAEIFKQAGQIKMEMLNTPRGIRVIETSTDARVVKCFMRTSTAFRNL